MGNGDYIVAIDLGTNTVTAVVGTPVSDGKLRIVDCEIAPMQGMVRGEIKNIELVAQSIKKAIEAIEDRLQIKIMEAYAGISGQHIRCVKYPYYVFVGRDEIREEDVQKLHESMANVQAPDGETIIQIIPQSYIVDDEETSSPVGSFGNKLEATFNFVLGDSNSVSRIKRVLSRVNIRQCGLYLNAIAAAEAVTTEDERQEGVAVVDIGAGTTEVAVFYKKTIRHVSIIPMGGNVINKDIRSYGILERHVENLKVKYGSALREGAPADKYITTPGLNARVPKEISFQNLAAIIEARMLDIIDYVMEQIKASGYADKLAGGVVLTGGSAQMKDLEKLFKNYTGLDVRVAAPDVVLDEESVDAVKTPAFATAVGLLIKGMASGKTTRTEKSRPVNAAPQRPAPAYGESNPYAVNDPEGRPTINDRYGQGGQYGAAGDTPFEEEQPEETPQKRGFLNRIKKRIEKVFEMDVIEDNEI